MVWGVTARFPPITVTETLVSIDSAAGAAGGGFPGGGGGYHFDPSAAEHIFAQFFGGGFPGMGGMGGGRRRGTGGMGGMGGAQP